MIVQNEELKVGDRVEAYFDEFNEITGIITSEEHGTYCVKRDNDEKIIRYLNCELSKIPFFDIGDRVEIISVPKIHRDHLESRDRGIVVSSCKNPEKYEVQFDKCEYPIWVKKGNLNKVTQGKLTRGHCEALTSSDVVMTINDFAVSSDLKNKGENNMSNCNGDCKCTKEKNIGASAIVELWYERAKDSIQNESENLRKRANNEDEVNRICNELEQILKERCQGLIANKAGTNIMYTVKVWKPLFDIVQTDKTDIILDRISTLEKSKNKEIDDIKVEVLAVLQNCESEASRINILRDFSIVNGSNKICIFDRFPSYEDMVAEYFAEKVESD